MPESPKASILSLLINLSRSFCINFLSLLILTSAVMAQGTGDTTLTALCSNTNGVGNPSTNGSLPEGIVGKGEVQSPPQTGPRSPGSEFGPRPDGSEKACENCPSTGGPSTGVSNNDQPNSPTKAVVTYPPGGGGTGSPGPSIQLSGPEFADLPPVSTVVPAAPPRPPPPSGPAGPPPGGGGGGAPGGGAPGNPGGGNGDGSSCETKFTEASGINPPPNGECRNENDCPTMAASDPANWTCNSDCKCELKPPPPGGGADTGATPQASTGVFQSGSGGTPSVPPTLASRPTLDGSWYTGSTVPWTNYRFWTESATGARKMSMYTSKGGVLIFEEPVAGSNTYVLSVELDQFNNEKRYTYTPSGTVDEIFESGIKTKYQEQGGSLIESSYACSLPSYLNCQLVTTKTFVYSSTGLLLSESVSAGQFVSEPASVTAPYDTAALSSGTVTREWVYYPNGLLKEEWLRSSTGAARLIYNLDWAYILGANRRIKSSSPGLDGSVIETNYTYEGTPSGGLILREIRPRMTQEIEYDSRISNAKILRKTVRPTAVNDGSTLFNELTTRYSYLPINGCNFVSEINYPNGSVWKGGWDTFYRLAWEVTTAANDDTAESSTFYEYFHPFDGSRLSSVWDEHGYRELRYQWALTAGDIRYHPTKISSWEWFVNGAGIDTANITDEYLDSRGQIVKKIEARQFREALTAGIVSEYAYEAPGEGTGRQMLKRVVTGPANSSGSVDVSSPFTTFARLELHPVLGLPVGVYEGPAGAEVGVQYSLDALGRVTGVNQGNRWSRYYYDAFGDLAVIKTANLDRNGVRPKGLDGRGGAENSIEQHLKREPVAGLLAAVLSDERAPFESRRFLTTSYAYTADGYPRTISYPLGDKAHVDTGWLGVPWRQYREIAGVTTLISESIAGLNQQVFRKLVGEGGSFSTTTTEFLLSGLPKRVFNDKGEAVALLYDARGNLLSQEILQSSTLLAKSQFEYDSLSRLIAEYRHNPATDEPKRVAQYSYGKFGVTSFTDEYGLVTDLTYNPDGSVSVAANTERVFRIEYEANMGRVSLSSRGTPTKQYATGYDYNQYGEISTIVSLGDGSELPQATTLQYDSLGNNTWTRTPDGMETERSVGADGFVYWTKITPAGAPTEAIKTSATKVYNLTQGFVTVTTKDEAGRSSVSNVTPVGLLDVTIPGRGKTQISRDNAFKIRELKNGTNISAIFSRDSFGDVTGYSVTKPTGSFSVTVNKDALGRVTGVTKSTGESITQQFGAFSEVTRQTVGYPGGQQRSFGFNRTGPNGFDLNKIFTVTDEDNGVTWSNDYDSVTGKLLQKSVGQGGQTIPAAFFQWNGGVLEKVIAGNGAETSYSYDGFGRVESKITTLGAQLVETMEIVERTAAGKVSKIAYPQSVTHQGRINNYDSLNRLVGYKLVPQVGDLALSYEAAPSVKTVTYNYLPTDPFRRASVTVTGAGALTKTYTIDAATGRYSSINGLSILYDALGNITRWGNTRYYYDVSNRLVKVDTTSGSILATFTYGADGNLATVTTPTEGTKRLRWVGSKWYVSEDAAGLQQFNVTDPFDYNALIGYFRKENGAFPATYNFTSMDSNSSAMRGSAVERYQYGPDGEFGMQSGVSSQFGQPQGYHGGYRVASAGVTYFGARFKIDQAAIFTQPDPDPRYAMFYDAEPTDNFNFVDKDGRAPVPGNDAGSMPFNERYELRGITNDRQEILEIKEQAVDVAFTGAAWIVAGVIAPWPTAVAGAGMSGVDIAENGANPLNITVGALSALPLMPKSVTSAVGRGASSVSGGARATIEKLVNGAGGLFRWAKEWKPRPAGPRVSGKAIDKIAEAAPEPAPSTPGNSGGGGICSDCVSDFRKMIEKGNQRALIDIPQVVREGDEIAEMLSNPNGYFDEQLKWALWKEAYESDKGRAWRSLGIDTNWLDHPLAPLLFGQDEITRCKNFDKLIGGTFKPPSYMSPEEENRLLEQIRNASRGKAEMREGRFLQEYYKGLPMNPYDIPDRLPENL